MSATDILQAASSLSRDDRIYLVQALWDMIADEPIPPPDAELRAELDRRIARCDAEPHAESSLEEHLRRVREKL